MSVVKLNTGTWWQPAAGEAGAKHAGGARGCLAAAGRLPDLRNRGGGRSRRGIALRVVGMRARLLARLRQQKRMLQALNVLVLPAIANSQGMG